MAFSQNGLSNAISYVSAAFGVPDGIEVSEGQLRTAGVLVGDDDSAPSDAEKMALVDLLRQLRLRQQV